MGFMGCGFSYATLQLQNAGEAKQIQKIVKAFKSALLPMFKGGKLNFPDIWDIGFNNINGPGFPTTIGSYKERWHS